MRAALSSAWPRTWGPREDASVLSAVRDAARRVEDGQPVAFWRGWVETSVDRLVCELIRAAEGVIERYRAREQAVGSPAVFIGEWKLVVEQLSEEAADREAARSRTSPVLALADEADAARASPGYREAAKRRMRLELHKSKICLPRCEFCHAEASL